MSALRHDRPDPAGQPPRCSCRIDAAAERRAEAAWRDEGTGDREQGTGGKPGGGRCDFFSLRFVRGDGADADQRCRQEGEVPALPGGGADPRRQPSTGRNRGVDAAARSAIQAGRALEGHARGKASSEANTQACSAAGRRGRRAADTHADRLHTGVDAPHANRRASRGLVSLWRFCGRGPDAAWSGAGISSTCRRPVRGAPSAQWPGSPRQSDPFLSAGSGPSQSV